MDLNFKKIDKKWQKKWEQTLKIDLNDDENKFYCLTMFSYPSGSKLHIGHWYNYGPTDSYARFMKMNGYNVFQPQGFDSFGLPAENAAIERGVHPADNVLVVLAPIELNRSRPVATDPSAAAFRAELEDWARITDRLLIWDYVIQFSNLVSPFPNLRVLQPNLRYFVDNSAVAHFQQGNREVGGEWAELRAYLIAKLLWNPDADVDVLIDDFLAGYYGAAAPHLRAYIDTQHDALAASGAGLSIFGNPIGASNTYLTAELMTTYAEQFDAAEAAGATFLAAHLQRFAGNGGISGVLVLAESHMSIHTWPERGFAAIDIFMCGACDPYSAVPVLERAFGPEAMHVNEQRRGLVP